MFAISTNYKNKILLIINSNQLKKFHSCHSFNFQTKTDDPAKRLVTHSARIVLSSENLIQRNISDDVRFGIFEQIAELLTISIMQFNDKEQQEIIDNVFKLTTGTKRLLLPFQHILTLLQSQKLPPNIGVHLWLKVANYVRDNLTENIDTYQELIYGYIEWVVKDPKIDQVISMKIFSISPFLCRFVRF